MDERTQPLRETPEIGGIRAGEVWLLRNGQGGVRMCFSEFNFTEFTEFTFTVGHPQQPTNTKLSHKQPTTPTPTSTPASAPFGY
jgi:hypothetical protein